jgi:ABC-type sugar transport system substrate-binding protein
MATLFTLTHSIGCPLSLIAATIAAAAEHIHLTFFFHYSEMDNTYAHKMWAAAATKHSKKDEKDG